MPAGYEEVSPDSAAKPGVPMMWKIIVGVLAVLLVVFISLYAYHVYKWWEYEIKDGICKKIEEEKAATSGTTGTFRNRY